MVNSILLRETEANLIKDIIDIGYGEIRDAVVDDKDDVKIKMDLSPKCLKLIRVIRSGYSEIKKIIIHQNEPQYAEVDGLTKFSKLPCTKKIKLD